MFVGFSKTDALNRTIQQRIRRIKDSLVHLHPSKLLGVKIETTSTSNESLSPVSGSSDDESSSSSELSRLSRKRLSPHEEKGCVKCKTTCRASHQVQADRKIRADFKKLRAQPRREPLDCATNASATSTWCHFCLKHQSPSKLGRSQERGFQRAQSASSSRVVMLDSRCLGQEILVG